MSAEQNTPGPLVTEREMAALLEKVPVNCVLQFTFHNDGTRLAAGHPNTPWALAQLPGIRAAIAKATESTAELSGEALSAATGRCFDTGGKSACADVPARRCTVCPNRAKATGSAA